MRSGCGATLGPPFALRVGEQRTEGDLTTETYSVTPGGWESFQRMDVPRSGAWERECCQSYQTWTRKRPQAGAVDPAIERSWASRMRDTSPLSHLWRPTFTSVPTMLRTML